MFPDIIDKPTMWTKSASTLDKPKVYPRVFGFLGEQNTAPTHISNLDESFEVRSKLGDWAVVEMSISNEFNNRDIEIKISDNLLISLPKQLDYLFDAINKSKYILNLEDNWDDEGAEKYNSDTLNNAIGFVIAFADRINQDSHHQIYVPKILHGPDKSIDIFWEEDGFRLIINIEESGNKASFYWDDGKDLSQFIEGTFELSKVNFNNIPRPLRVNYGI